MAHSPRRYSLFDNLCVQLDQGLRAVTGATSASMQRYPAASLPVDEPCDARERRRRAALMRINHSGEVCAQALYHGQAVSAKTATTRALLMKSAAEESEHLAWCAARLAELNDRKSYLNAIWYTSSFLLGVLIGLKGDAASLGFVAETERQVSAHLENHLQKLTRDASTVDTRSKAILQQMQCDEVQHGEKAFMAGGKPLPWLARMAMRLASRMMTTTAYWV